MYIVLLPEFLNAETTCGAGLHSDKVFLRLLQFVVVSPTVYLTDLFKSFGSLDGATNQF